MSDTITSLCYVSSVRDTRVELCRIADLSNNSFFPYSYDLQVDFYEYDRDLIYGPKTRINDSYGTIGMYEWSPWYDQIEGKWKTDAQLSEANWVEVFMTDYRTPEEVIRKLRDGWPVRKPFGRAHDILFCCRKIDFYPSCVYLPKDEFFIEGNVIKVSNQIDRLSVIEIDVRQVEACEGRYCSNDGRKYLRSKTRWEIVKTIWLKSKSDIVSQIVNGYLKTASREILSRKEKQRFATVLERIDNKSLTEAITDRLQCQEEEAEQYINECIQNKRIHLEDPETIGILDALIENDSVLVQDLRRKIEKQWRNDQAEEIEKSEVALIEVQKCVSERKEELSKLNDEIQQRQQEIKKCSEQLDETMRFQEDVEKEIQQRLLAFKKDRAAVLVESVYMQSIASTQVIGQADQSQQRTNSKHNYSIHAPEDAERVEHDTVSAAFLEAREVWKDICADDSLSEQLAVFFFAAFARRQPLLITGECAVLCADVFASSVTGLPCVKIYLDGDASVEEIICDLEGQEHTCLCFVDALGDGYAKARMVMEHFKKSHIVFTAQHEESLLMEPSSLFTTFLSVYADSFCCNNEIVRLSHINCSEKLLSDDYVNPNHRILSGFIGKQRNWFSKGFFSPLLKARCAYLHQCIDQICKENGLTSDVSTRIALRFLLVPIMKSLRKPEVISDVLNNCEGVLDDTVKRELLAFAEAEDL